MWVKNLSYVFMIKISSMKVSSDCKAFNIVFKMAKMIIMRVMLLPLSVIGMPLDLYEKF